MDVEGMGERDQIPNQLPQHPMMAAMMNMLQNNNQGSPPIDPMVAAHNFFNYWMGMKEMEVQWLKGMIIHMMAILDRRREEVNDN